MDEADVSEALEPGRAMRQRQLTIGDLLWIVSGVALTLGLERFWRTELMLELPTYRFVGMALARWTHLAGEMMSVLIPLTMTTLILRFQRPRPRFSRIIRQRGSLACLAVVFGLAVNLLMLPLTQSTMGPNTTPFLTICWYWPGSLAAMVAGAWLLLYFMRGWPGNSDWIDRIGMLLGVGWISIVAIVGTVTFLSG